MFFDAAGTCVVDFNQAGNGTYAPAAQAQRTITVTKVGTTRTVHHGPRRRSSGRHVTATATVTADSGTPGGTVQFSVDGTDRRVTVSGGTAAAPS